jgi:rRNA maturation RNase YbeY
MISFIFENVEIPEWDKLSTVKWIKIIASHYDKQVGNVHYTFCNDNRMLEINKQFLNHDYYTDIITFDYSKHNKIAGDIYVSLDTVRSNAATLGIEETIELSRIIIHGVLHLCGQNDTSPEERAEMTAKENEALAILIKI